MPRSCSIARVLASILLALPAAAAGDDAWPEFRGPRGDGHSSAKGLPLEWSETRNVRWKTPIHGRAWSTPVVLGDQVWVTTATEDGKELSALCIDRGTGKVLFDKVLFRVEKPQPLGNTVNGYGSPSPAIEPGRIYVTFGSAGTACLDTRSFEVLWERRDLPCNHYRGPASSLVLFKGLVIFQMDGSDHQYIVALDGASGATAWKTPRSTDYGDLDANGRPRAEGDFRKAFNTPLIVEWNGAPLMLSAAAKAVYGYEPATGRELWQVRHANHSSASRPVFHQGMAFFNIGYSHAELWAVKAGGNGDVSASHVPWKNSKSVPNRASPVIVEGLLYMVSDKGVATCLEAESGAEVWQDRADGNYSASLLYADGRIHLFSEEGVATILKPGRKFEVLARNTLADGFMASPAAAGRELYLRTRSCLYRIESAP
jgi:outer membrane protein assembly factor BamB